MSRTIQRLFYMMKNRQSIFVPPMLCLFSVVDFLTGHLPAHGNDAVPAAPSGSIVCLFLLFGQLVHRNIAFHMIAPFWLLILSNSLSSVKAQKGTRISPSPFSCGD